MFQNLLTIAIAGFALVAVGETANAEAPQPELPASISISWSTKGGLDHALAGKVWSRHAQAIVGPAQLQQSLQRADIAIVGEIHDNPDHRAVQVLLWRYMRSDARTVPLVMEQISVAQQRGLDTFTAARADGTSQPALADLKTYLDWEKAGWSGYDYDPILREVIQSKMPLVAGDVAPSDIRSVAKGGETALTQELRARLALDRPLGAALDKASRDEIAGAHCGMMPASAFAGMAFAQRYRDAHLADATLTAAGQHGAALLVAGNVHARYDRGVPWYLTSRAPERNLVTVIVTEVEDGVVDPAAYVPRDPDGRPAADYVVFTPRASRGDPCEAFKGAKSGNAP